MKLPYQKLITLDKSAVLKLAKIHCTWTSLPNLVVRFCTFISQNQKNLCKSTLISFPKFKENFWICSIKRWRSMRRITSRNRKLSKTLSIKTSSETWSKSLICKYCLNLFPISSRKENKLIAPLRICVSRTCLLLTSKFSSSLYRRATHRKWNLN